MDIIQKVTDPRKMVTDHVVLKELQRQGIDASFVEFYQDYAPRKLGKGHSPYAKFYQDLVSGKQFMVVSGLPMVDADGNKIEVGWRLAGINYFAEKNNLFRAKVQGAEVEVTVRNDQPDGRKAGDKLTYKPQLFLDGLEQTCGQSLLLPVDPINPNYPENTLEWDYGICKRRLRIIEGHVLGCWVFPANPLGEVRIKYNQTGDYKLKLGQYVFDSDTEVVPASVFASADYPLTVSDSATFYPDADPETSSVDGYASMTQNNSTWAAIRDGAGNVTDNNNSQLRVAIVGGTNDNTWGELDRGIFLYDTSGLPDAAIISAAVLSLYGIAKLDQLAAAPDINVYASAPASNTAIGAGDYTSLGVAAFCDTPITYVNWIYADPFWNNFALNAAGIAAISKTSVSKFGARNVNYDVADGAPSWVTGGWSYFGFYASEQGAGYKPKLVVTYSTPTVVTPTTLALTTSLYASTVTVTNNITVTPTTLSLSLTLNIPVVGLGIVPPTLALSVTPYAPSLIYGTAVTPSSLALTITGYAPSMEIDVVVVPTTLALTQTFYAPSIINGTIVTPGTLTLTITHYAPGLIYGTVVTPTTLALALTGYAPFAVLLRIIAIASVLSVDLAIASILSTDLEIASTLSVDLTIASTLSTDLEIVSSLEGG